MNTVSSTTSDREYIEINNSTYIVESYYTHSESYLTTAEQSSGMSDVTALTRESTSGTSSGYETVTTGTTYLTKQVITGTRFSMGNVHRMIHGNDKTISGIITAYSRSTTSYGNSFYYNPVSGSFSGVYSYDIFTYDPYAEYYLIYSYDGTTAAYDNITTGTSYGTSESVTGTTALTQSSTSGYSGVSSSSTGNWS